MDETLTLIAGALIAIITGIATYAVNHFLSLREKKVARDFAVREKGRDYFHLIYGTVTTLSDMVVPFAYDENTTEAMILTEKGYIALPKKDIIARYKTAYEKYAKLWYDSREKGLEIFLMRDFVEIMFHFWAYASYFYEDTIAWDNKDAIKKFEEIRNLYCNNMDKLMGLAEPTHIPKWLNTKKWSTILRGKDDGSIV